MDLKVYKKGEEYFVTFLQFKTNIKQYYIKKSFDLAQPVVKDFHFNLNENSVDLYNNPINIFAPSIKLEPLHNVKHYYTIVLIADNGLEYAFYIDYNKFYNIEKENEIYYYNFMKPIFFDIEKIHTKFYLKGIFGDIHQIDLYDIKNKNEAFFKVPSKKDLISETYEIIAEMNGNRIFKGKFPILTKDSIDFVINYEDYGNVCKVILNPKYNYCTLDSVYVYHGDELMNKKTRNKLDLTSTIRDVSFYIPAQGFNKHRDFRIEYTISESTASTNNSFTKVCNITLDQEREQTEVFNVNSYYSHDSDVCNISWENKSKKPLNYLVELGGKKYYTQDRFISIENFKEFNNNNVQIPVTIKCAKLKKELLTSHVCSEHFITNYNFMDRSNLFTPVIDYSETICCDRAFGRLKWTTPNFRHYAKVKINSLVDERFLDEFKKPWVKDFILNKEAPEFDKVYTDYEQELVYNFNKVGVNSRKVKDSMITYDSRNDGWQYVDQNYIDIPLWFNLSGHKYHVDVELYDMFNNKIGASSCEFTIKDYDVSSLEITDMLILRNQFLQFGEQGTIGDFHKVENPRPIDVRNHYAEEFKTFLGQELSDRTNMDHEGNSLFYYFNTNEGQYIEIKYQRRFNFYKVLFVILDGEEEIHRVEHIPRGDNYEENFIRIDKNKFTKEGEYTMKIQTFSSSGQASKTKDVSFFVHNEKPEKPFVRIKAEDYYENNNEIKINKKYFEIEVTNNDLSSKYAGWKFKETHFFFRTLDVPFLPFADYVIQTNISDGSIVMKNNVPIENGDYECKVINYDYAGNASEPHIFQFKLRSEIKITPYEIFTNKPRQNMKWKFKKSQDSEGFYYFFRYSKDGITYKDYTPVKVDSPYFVDKNEDPELELDIEWLKDVNGHLEGYYKLVAYEFSRKHPNGQPQYEFESPIVEVNELANPSNPIYAKAIPGNVVVFNASSHIEWAYTNDLNKLVFETLHNEMVVDNPDTPNVEDMNYKIVLIEPHRLGESPNNYNGIIPQPSVIGNFTFDNIATLCGVENQKEGVWEIRFITTDKYGNTNESRGYYTYRVNVVKRLPVINNMTIANGNGSKYFGLYSDIIGFYVDSSAVYKDIENYDDFKEMFPISSYEVKFIENPFNNQYALTVKPDNNGCISVLSKLTENDKVTHSKDGRYNVLITSKDPLGRSSQQIDRSFYIDTKTDAEVSFVNNNVFINKTVDLRAVATDKVKKVYYKTSDVTSEAPKFDIEEIKKWTNVDAKSITIGENFCYGIEILNVEYATDGYKTLYYVIEEDSGNMGAIKAYTFKIDTTNMLIPNFDYTNKIYFSKDDDEIRLSWYNTNDAVNKFEIKLDKVIVNGVGELEVIKSYVVQVDNISTVIPVGPGENTYVGMGDAKEVRFRIDPESLLITGQYMLTVKGYNIYGTEEENYFVFQIDYTSLTDLAAEIINNRITLDNNMITWANVKTCDFYEVSYDNKSWIKTTENRFFVNTEIVQKDDEGYAFIYLRWKSKTGIYSKSSKIRLSINMKKIEKPEIAFFKETITDYNKMLRWKVTVKEPEKVKGIYYSFDKLKWHYKPITSMENIISNDTVSYPVEDGIYDIFVVIVDDDPTMTEFYNKSEMTHSYAKVFAKDIAKPVFSGVINGSTLNNPTRLFIENKEPDVKYYIYVNKKIVDEGYEIASSTLRKFQIEVKAKKHGIEKVFTLINEADEFHVWSLCNEPYLIDINNSKILVSIDHENTSMVLESTPSLNNKQVVLYREKGENSKWNVFNKGDSLSLLTEWEFHISSITVI